MDIMGIMKKAQAMQSKLAETQEELGKIEVEGVVAQQLVVPAQSPAARIEYNRGVGVEVVSLPNARIERRRRIAGRNE